MEYLFTTKISNLDWENLSMAGFKCFQTLFLQINVNQDKMETQTSGKESKTVVVDFNLVGLESLWQLALSARQPAVADNAITYLMGLYEKVKNDNFILGFFFSIRV